MDTGSGDSLLTALKKKGQAKWMAAGVLTLVAIALVCLFLYSKSRSPVARPATVEAGSSGGELVSLAGAVLSSTPGRADWRPVTVGAHLREGDLVQTAKSGEACIRYSNGTTVTIQESTIFTVRSSGDGSMDISVAAPEVPSDNVPRAASGQDEAAENPASPISLTGENAAAARLFIKLDRIVPFGRSLELIGKVEPGSKLAVNNELADVAGDGAFKHFTNPFPANVQKVDLVLKVTDLAGRTRTVMAAYDFRKRSGAR